MAPTTPSKLLENAMKYADEPALSTPTSEGWATETWSEFAAYVMDVTRALVALGFEPGDKLSIYSYNRREWYGGYLAAQMVGGAGVGVYHTSSAEEVEWVIGNSDSKVAVVGHNPMAAGDQSKMPQHRLMQVIDALDGVEHFVLLPGVAGVEHAKLMTWDAFMGHGRRCADRWRIGWCGFVVRLRSLRNRGALLLLERVPRHVERDALPQPGGAADAERERARD